MRSLLMVFCFCSSMAGMLLGLHPSFQPWTDTATPGWGRAAVQADDSATLHRRPERRTRVARFLQTKIYTTVASGLVPEIASPNALHIALASVHRIDFPVTWNFKHIANPHIRARMRTKINDSGYRMPVMCSPEELLSEAEANGQSNEGD